MQYHPSGFAVMDLLYYRPTEFIRGVAMMTAHFNGKGTLFQNICQIGFGEHRQEAFYTRLIAMAHELDPPICQYSRCVLLEPFADNGFRHNAVGKIRSQGRKRSHLFLHRLYGSGFRSGHCLNEKTAGPQKISFRIESDT